MTNCSVLDKLKQQYPRRVLVKKVSLRPATLLEKRLRQRCFPVNFANFYEQFFLRTPMVTAS